MAATAETVKELEKKQEWWWAAEKKRSRRLDYLRKAMWKKGAIGGLYPAGLQIDLERPVMQTEKAKELESSADPYVIKFAKMLAHVLDNKTIFITDRSQLVGYLGSAPNMITWDPTLAAILNHEVFNDPDSLPQPLDESLKVIRDVTNYWGGKSDLDKILPHMDLGDVMKVLSGAIGWGVPLGRGGYSGKDYEYIMTGVRAFEDIIEELDRRIDEADARSHRFDASREISDLIDKINNWEAMKITLEAGIRHARRYARLARIIAENFESDAVRREELVRVAETCERVPAKPPRTLQESLQYDLFIQLFSRNEAIEGAWPARPDFYHGPYYERDVNIRKTLTWWASSSSGPPRCPSTSPNGPGRASRASRGPGYGRWAA
ncbi:MAG TPA: pyruvate formate lyase family protein [Deltaproteobacteria bacterium]|nr:pyruvate formate lyase family protein [Deltaproteobacteria bacterium]